MNKTIRKSLQIMFIVFAFVLVFFCGRISGRDKYFAQGYVSSYFNHSSICSIMVNPELKKTEYKNFFNDNGRLKIDYKIYDDLLKSKIEKEYTNRINTNLWDTTRDTGISIF